MEVLHAVRDNLVPALDGVGAVADRLLPADEVRSDSGGGKRATPSAKLYRPSSR